MLGVDLSPYAEKLDKRDDGECLYVVGEITDLAQTAQRVLDVQTYLPPILAGPVRARPSPMPRSPTPLPTRSAARWVGFANRLTLQEPFCPGPKATKTANAYSYSYAFDAAMPEPAILLVQSDTVDAVSELASAEPGDGRRWTRKSLRSNREAVLTLLIR